MKTSITFEVDTDKLESFTDVHLSHLWHISQANGAPFGDAEACEVAELIGREIIRRWLLSTPVELWAHQGRHVQTARQIGEASA